MFPKGIFSHIALSSLGLSGFCSAIAIQSSNSNLTLRASNAQDVGFVGQLGSTPVGALPVVWEGSLPMAHGGAYKRDSSDLTESEVSCSRSKPCKVGCCGLDDNGKGKCGSGPRYCGRNCTSGCDWKSQCDPGWGMEFSASSKCPLNACCSPYGFCGTTEAFCKGHELKRPSCPSGGKAKPRRVGYYQGWDLSKRPCGKMSPEKIPAGYYSHINLASAHIDHKTSRIVPKDETESMHRRASKLKSKQPDLEVWLSIGGGKKPHAEPFKGGFSHMASGETSQDAFLDSLMELMDKPGFDGVDLNWEYPGDEETGGKREDFENLVTVCRRIRERFDELGRGGLSVTLPTPYKYMKGYNLKELEKHVDWFNFMAYDLHGIWEMNTSTVENRAYAHTNLTEIEQQLDLLWRNHVNPEKIVLGLAFYGRSFTMSDAKCKGAGCPFRDAGRAGKCTQSAGILSAPEILDIAAGAQGGKVTVKTDKQAAVRMMAWGEDQWVSYDDAETLRMKMDFASSRCLAGTMIWSIDMDDGRLTEALAEGL